jgi:hypothetical protein
MWLLGILVCLALSVTSAKVERCSQKEAKDFIESSSGREVVFLQQFPQDGTCRVKFRDSSRYYVCNYVCMLSFYILKRSSVADLLCLY